VVVRFQKKKTAVVAANNDVFTGRNVTRRYIVGYPIQCEYFSKQYTESHGLIMSKLRKDMIKDFCKLLGIKKLNTTAHPRQHDRKIQQDTKMYA